MNRMKHLQKSGQITEAFLHFVWKFGLFNTQKLTTESGETVTILMKGRHNHDSGPDFFNAKVQIGNTLWVGNVELHVAPESWYRHNHHTDRAYNNVILHVAYEASNQQIVRENGQRIPCISLKGRIQRRVLEKYRELHHPVEWIPCEKLVAKVEPIVLHQTIDRMVAERVETKIRSLERILSKQKDDWKAAFFVLLFENFGMKKNATAFRLLSHSLPYTIVLKHRRNRLKLEALLFGQAGFLFGRFQDAYPKLLQKEYRYLQRLYRLKPIDASVWKFLRLRPSNFPTVRLAQLTALLNGPYDPYECLMSNEGNPALRTILDVKTSSYWDAHYVFDRAAICRPKTIGRSMIEHLLINCFVPFAFLLGKHKGDDRLCTQAMRQLAEIGPEKNRIVNQWTKIGVQSKSAFDTQGLLHLKSNYCSEHRCLSCSIGAAIMGISKNNLSS